MNLLSWILFGLITGIIANIIDPHPARDGWLGTIILGVLGAILGGFLGNIVFGVGVTGFNVSSFTVAVLGTLLLVFIGRAFGRT